MQNTDKKNRTNKKYTNKFFGSVYTTSENFLKNIGNLGFKHNIKKSFYLL